MKYITTVFIIILLVISNFLWAKKSVYEYKVLHIKSPDEIYLDINKNDKVDENELVKIYNISAFRPERNKDMWYQTRTCSCSWLDIAATGVLAQEFAEELLLGKTVKVEFNSIKTKSPSSFSMAKIYIDGKDYAKILLNNGFATPRKKIPQYIKAFNYVKLEENLEKIKHEKFYIVNPSNNIYHTLDCKYGKKLKQARVVRQNSVLKTGKPCNYCILKTTKKRNYTKFKKRKRAKK